MVLRKTQHENGLDDARSVFEPRAGRSLSDEDLREIQTNLVGFFLVLHEWSQVCADEPSSNLSSKE